MSVISTILPEQSEDMAASFRQAMRNLVGGVTVLTVGQGAERTGMTVTSFSAFSTEPPSVIVCVNTSSSSYPVLVRERQFGASILAAHQEDVAARFAGRGGIKGPERYEGSVWQVNATGVSVLADALATFDCEVEDLLERHSHVIVIGRVRSVVRPGGSGALLYWRGEFDQIGWTYEQVNRACGVQPIR